MTVEASIILSNKKVHGNTGRKFSDEHRRKISEFRKGRKHSKETLEKMSRNRKGRLVGMDNPMYGKNRKGMNNPMYGKKHSKEIRERISTSLKGKQGMSKEKHPNWKGYEQLHYVAIHQYMRKEISKPALCPLCNERPA